MRILLTLSQLFSFIGAPSPAKPGRLHHLCYAYSAREVGGSKQWQIIIAVLKIRLSGEGVKPLGFVWHIVIWKSDCLHPPSVYLLWRHFQVTPSHFFSFIVATSPAKPGRLRRICNAFSAFWFVFLNTWISSHKYIKYGDQRLCLP